jgi:hypothetical protein
MFKKLDTLVSRNSRMTLNLEVLQVEVGVQGLAYGWQVEITELGEVSNPTIPHRISFSHGCRSYYS